MSKIFQYISQPAGRDKVMQVLGLFSIIGGAIVSAILFAAILWR
jgi:hypothetical protein